MKYAHIISGIFWLAIGLLLSLWSTRYQIGNFVQPGPGLYPLLLGVLLILFALALLGQAIKSSPILQKVQPFSLSGGWKRVANVVLILLLVAFFLGLLYECLR